MGRLFVTAHHEAAHAVVNYRACGHAGGPISIVPDSELGLLGTASDGVSDSFDEEHTEARILSCYAGGHAQRRIDPAEGTNGCDIDDEIAADLLRQWGWGSRERELRDRAAELVNRHWSEIVAVAEDLLERHVLDETEVETLADIAAGVEDVSAADLQRYRMLKGGA